jgi:hypothetical protein
VRFLTSLLYLASVALRLAVVIVPPLLMRPMLGSSLAMSFFVPLVWITVTLVVLFFKEIRNYYGGGVEELDKPMDDDVTTEWRRPGHPFYEDLIEGRSSINHK